MKQAASAVILTYITIILTTIVGLVITPLMVRSWGVQEYGLYVLSGSLVAQLTVMDFGLNNAIVRFISRYRASSDAEEEARFISAVIWMYSAIAFLVFAVGVLLLNYLDRLTTGLDPRQANDARIMVCLLIVNAAILLPTGAFGAICVGYERFAWPRAIQLIKYLVRSGAVIALLIFGAKGVGVVIIDTLLNVLFAAVNAFYVFRRIGLRVRLFRFDFERTCEILSYSGWIFVLAIVSQFQWNAGQVMLASLAGVQDVAIYGAGVQLGTYYGAFGAAVTGLLLPRATAMVICGASGEKLTTQLVRVARVTLVLLSFPLGGFLIFGRIFIALWLGNVFMPAYLVALLVMGSYSLPLIQGFANSLLEARAEFRAKAIAYLLFIPSGIVAGAYFVPTQGLLALALGSCAGWIAGQIVVNIYYRKAMGIRLDRFFRELTNGLLPAFLLSLLPGFALSRFISHDWLGLTVGALGYGLILASLTYCIGLNCEERTMITQMIRRRLVHV